MKDAYQSTACSKLDDESKASLKRLLDQAYDSENSEKRLKSLIWTCEENPHAGEKENRYYFIKTNTETLAYNGRMPIKILFKSQLMHAYFVHETLVDLDSRRKGLGIQVNKNVLEDSKGLCLGLWANEKLLPILLKIGWIPIGQLKPLRKLLTLDNIVNDKIRSPQLRKLFYFFGNIYLTRRKRKRLVPSSGIKTYEIIRFTDDMQESLDTIMKKFHILVYRNPAYLNWKYIDIPYVQYKAYGVKKDNVFRGYIVLRFQVDPEGILRKGMIVDFLCDPDERECFFALFNTAEEYFAHTRTDFIVCLSTDARFRNWLKKLGFYQPRSKTKNFFLLANIDYSNNEQFVNNFPNWYLTYGDSDYDMLIGELRSGAR